jgi:membrane protein DedA with SNARE-associated domain
MEFLQYLIHHYGLFAVGAIVGLECIGFPLPGQMALLVAAIYAGIKHDLDIVSVIITAGATAIVGRMIGYLIGREYGYWLLLRYGNYIRMSKSRIKLGQYLFLRHGGKIVFVAQFVPVLRTIAGVFAGCNVMPWRNFLIANIVGSTLWAVSYGYGAYALGLSIKQLEGPIAIELAILTIVSFIIGGIFIHRHEVQLAAEAERAMPGPLKPP